MSHAHTDLVYEYLELKVAVSTLVRIMIYERLEWSFCI